MSTPKKSINELYNSELYLHFYADSLTAERTGRECDYIIEHGQLKAPQRILDLACGHGRHANYFARRGFSVVGVDINKQFIELARAEALKDNLAVEFLEEDILKMNYDGVFDAAILLFNTLGFFDKTDCRKLFQKIGLALKPGGRAFIDTRNRDQVLKGMVPYEVTEKGEDLMIDRLTFDPKTGTTTNKRIYYKDGIRYDAPFTMYSYHYGDLASMVEGSGLEIIKAMGGWKHEPLDSKARRIVLLLEKR